MLLADRERTIGAILLGNTFINILASSLATSLLAARYGNTAVIITTVVMTFVVLVPAIAAMLPGLELTPKLAVVPILNVSLLCKELVAGTYHWNYIFLIFLSTSVYAGVALYLAVKMFQRESVLFSS